MTSTSDLGPKSATPAGQALADSPSLRPWQFFLLAGMLSATAVVVVASGQSPAAVVILSLTVVASSLVAMGVYRALAPLVFPERHEATAVVAGRAQAALEREKALVLRSIKELEFDFSMNKIAARDFEELSERLRQRAIGLMRQLDAGQEYSQLIERELQARLVKRVGASRPSGLATPAVPAEEVPMSPATEMTGRRCEPCGVLNDFDARFCKSCGTGMAEGDSQ
ncbi:MAG: hypothetical protein ACT4QD_26070 [Acidobacteriota bacterium]